MVDLCVACFCWPAARVRGPAARRSVETGNQATKLDWGHVKLATGGGQEGVKTLKNEVKCVLQPLLCC